MTEPNNGTITDSPPWVACHHIKLFTTSPRKWIWILIGELISTQPKVNQIKTKMLQKSQPRSNQQGVVSKNKNNDKRWTIFKKIQNSNIIYQNTERVETKPKRSIHFQGCQNGTHRKQSQTNLNPIICKKIKSEHNARVCWNIKTCAQIRAIALWI